MPTSISKYRPSISKLHIVPDIEAKSLTFDIEGLVFDIVHISISGILLRYRSLARFQMLGIVNRSTYSVRTGTSRYTTCYGTVPPCSALLEYVLFTPSTYQYVLFTPSTYLAPSTYQVRTSQKRMYLVRTEYRIHDKSTYLRLKVQTFRVAYQYVPVCTKYILF